MVGGVEAEVFRVQQGVNDLAAARLAVGAVQPAVTAHVLQPDDMRNVARNQVARLVAAAVDLEHGVGRFSYQVATEGVRRRRLVGDQAFDAAAGKRLHHPERDVQVVVVAVPESPASACGSTSSCSPSGGLWRADGALHQARLWCIGSSAIRPSRWHWISSAIASATVFAALKPVASSLSELTRVRARVGRRGDAVSAGTFAATRCAMSRMGGSRSRRCRSPGVAGGRAGTGSVGDVVDMDVGPCLRAAENGDQAPRQRLHGQHVDRNIKPHARRNSRNGGRADDLHRHPVGMLSSTRSETIFVLLYSEIGCSSGSSVTCSASLTPWGTARRSVDELAHAVTGGAIGKLHRRQRADFPGQFRVEVAAGVVRHRRQVDDGIDAGQRQRAGIAHVVAQHHQRRVRREVVTEPHQVDSDDFVPTGEQFRNRTLPVAAGAGNQVS